MPRISISGSLFVFLGAAFWSLNSPLVKYLTLNPILVCGLRSLIAAAVLSEGIFFALMTVSSKKVGGSNPVGLTAAANMFTGTAMFLLFPNALAGVTNMTSLDWLIMLILGGGRLAEDMPAAI